MIARFVAEMSRIAPEIPAEVHQLRILFMAGAMSHSLFHFDKLASATGNTASKPDMATLKSEMVNFIATGLSATTIQKEK